MNFDDFDAQMRCFEKSLDQIIPADVHIVARLDGRGFTRLTKRVMSLERPFDRRFHDMMADTAAHLMQCGFTVVYAYWQSDEISLLIQPGEEAFGRNARKINSILAGEASAAFSLALGQAAVLDCRVCPLPAALDVVDYFRWRSSDALRNSLNSYCYWTLRGENLSGGSAAKRLSGLLWEEKEAMLRERGIIFDATPAWQRQGSGLLWRTVEKEGLNPVTGERVLVMRRRLERLDPAPAGDEIRELISGLI